MIRTWSVGRTDRHMDESILTDLADVVAAHPWWRARASLTLDLLNALGVTPPDSVLDVGCGWGVTLDALEKRGFRAAGLDIAPGALKRLDRPDRRLFEADLTADLPADPPRFRAVLALDVLEHLDDDRAAVARLGDLADPGGVVVVSVPARPDLFSEYDEVQGHRRRYTAETLTAAFDGSGLAVDRLIWWGRWMVPMVRRQRRRRLARPGEAPVETYRRYLELRPWPAPWCFGPG